MLLFSGLHGKYHVIIENDYFSNVELFLELASMETYVVGTICVNCMGLACALKSLKIFYYVSQGMMFYISMTIF